MPNYLYNQYIKKIANRFDASLSSIQAGYNFDFGDEFEVAICQVLRSALPDNFGICRGHVVDRDGNQAGDDIIIYEQSRFPTFGLREKDDYSRKEFIPIEAVYCYIEAKHTLHLMGEDRQSLQSTINQMAKVKAVISRRPKVPFSRFLPYRDFSKNFKLNIPDYYPRYANPIFTMIFANKVKLHPSGEVLTRNDLSIFDDEYDLGFNAKDIDLPDLIVLGRDAVILPTLIPDDLKSRGLYMSPFFLPQKSRYAYLSAHDVSFGIAISSLLWALDWIQLGELPWKDIITNALDIPHADEIDPN